MAGYFSIFLTLITLATGLIWLADHFLLAPKRKHKIAGVEQETGVELEPEAKHKLAPQPAWIEVAISVFPVFAFVLVLRSFLYEPFQIPSGSMMPTLLKGDFILVEKFSYGLKDPVARNKFVETGLPQRGDVAVFKYPRDRNVDFIKRIIGLPGDVIIYRDKKLLIKPSCDNAPTQCDKFYSVPLTTVNHGEYTDVRGYPLERSTENLLGVEHDILRNPVEPSRIELYYKQAGTKIDEFVVPEGKYFAMGDNRDNSSDGRIWGFVDEKDMVGKAVAIWMSFEFENGPDSWLPSFVPTGIRFERIGGIQ